MFRSCLFLCLIISTAPILSCGDDAPVVPPPPQDCPFYYCDPPPSRERVLANLQASYNQKNMAKFDALLDQDFVFIFAPADVGGNIPPKWGRVEELYVTALFFDVTGPQPGTWSIDADIKFETGVQWIEIVPATFPDEVWYTTTVAYEFFAQLESLEAYMTPTGAKAQFTVRNAGTAEYPLWKLVEWRDLGVVNTRAQAFGITDKTWGGFKALFVPVSSSP